MNADWFNKISELQRTAQQIAKAQNIIAIPEVAQIIIDKKGLYAGAAALRKVSPTIAALRRLRTHPEIQFIIISDLSESATKELINTLAHDTPDNFITEKEAILEEHLLPYLRDLNVEKLWQGANFALISNDNPDRLRHSLVSLRTLLEFFIDMLAPIRELKKLEKFKGGGKITRSDRIEYFASKIDFGVLEEFNPDDIKFVCACYKILCNIHNTDVGLSENQVRILKIKTGIVLWLLAYIYGIINEGQKRRFTD